MPSPCLPSAVHRFLLQYDQLSVAMKDTTKKYHIGIDVGGTKIAGVLLDDTGAEQARQIHSTPSDYSEFLKSIEVLVDSLRSHNPAGATIGVGIPGIVDQETGKTPFVCNVPCLSGHALRADLEMRLGCAVPMANDAGCAALSEAVDGAGTGRQSVFTLVMGTGVGGGLVINRQIIHGANNIAGEIGHLPLPFRDETDGRPVPCNCGQIGCLDKTISGGGLERLFCDMGGSKISATDIAVRANDGDVLATKALDRFYTTVAKAMVVILHSFDPDIIVVTGGLSALPELVETVPHRWGQFALSKSPKTELHVAKHGALTGVRGAAWYGAVGK